MSKLQSISDAVATRLAAITTANGYSTDAANRIVRGQTQINPDEVPAIWLYLGQRTAESEVGYSARQTVSLTVEIVDSYTSNPEQTGITLLDDIAKAVEDKTDTDLGGLLRSPLSWQSDEIFYPESAQRLVGARVIYEAPHVRRYGNPE